MVHKQFNSYTLVSHREKKTERKRRGGRRKLERDTEGGGQWTGLLSAFLLSSGVLIYSPTSREPVVCRQPVFVPLCKTAVYSFPSPFQLAIIIKMEIYVTSTPRLKALNKQNTSRWRMLCAI